MPGPTIKIKDILIQGCMGQKILNRYPPYVCDLKEVSSIPSADYRASLPNSRYFVVTSGVNRGLFFYNKSTNSLQKIFAYEKSFFDLQLYCKQYPEVLSTQMSIKTLETIKKLTGHSIVAVEPQPKLAPNPEVQTPEQLLASYGVGYSLVDYADNKYLVNPATTPQAILYSEDIFTENRLSDVLELIESIKNHALEAQEDLDVITRVISDEFTFYPANKPYTLAEYKAIINKAAEATGSLPANIHLVFATFPVIWPDGKLRNCGLYVSSPLHIGEPPRIHHFAKRIPFKDDPSYLQADGTKYVYNTKEDNANSNFCADRVLEDTQVQTNDVNQYQSAFKIVGVAGQDLLVSVGICFDHSTGMERSDVHCLTEQLQVAGQDVPMHCSHVITSYSISQYKQHTVSTVSHADPLARNRRLLGAELLGRSGFIDANLHSGFSGILHSEHYPAKAIGIVHSDMFQHNISSKSSSEVVDELNQQDENGNTLLHKVFLETNYDGELIAKRLYFLILHGGDPYFQNFAGKSVIDLANDLSIVSSLVVTKAINSALQWREAYAEQNAVSEIDGHTKLTRHLAKSRVNNSLADYILAGANPYIKNAHGKTAMEMLAEHQDLENRIFVVEAINQTMLRVQNGYQRPGVAYVTDSDETFPPYIPQNIRAIDRPEITDFLHDFSSFYQSNESTVDVKKISEMRSKIMLLQNVMMRRRDADSMKLAYDALGYQLAIIGISLPARDKTLSDFDLMQNFKIALQSALFVKFKAVFADTIQKAEDLSVFETLSGIAGQELFNLIKLRLGMLLQKVDNFDFIKALSPENIEEVFKFIKPRLTEFINFDSGLCLTSYLRYLTESLQAVIVEELIAQVEANSISVEDYEFTFINGLTPYLAERFLNAIPEELWPAIAKKLDLSTVLDCSQHSPQIFLSIFAKINKELLNYVGSSHPVYQTIILEKLSKLSAEYLQVIQGAVLLIIQRCNLLALQENLGQLKVIISKIFAPDKFIAFQEFLETLDEPQQQQVMHSINDELEEIFTPDSSIRSPGSK